MISPQSIAQEDTLCVGFWFPGVPLANETVLGDGKESEPAKHAALLGQPSPNNPLLRMDRLFQAENALQRRVQSSKAPRTSLCVCR